MIYDLNNMPSSQAYQLLTQVVIPRPVAWVLTQDKHSNVNIAPFSFFAPVSSNPPLLMLSIGKKQDRSPKDTLHNITTTERFVVHIGNTQDAKAMSLTAKELPHGESEAELANIELTEFDNFQLPRIAHASVALGCELYRVDEIGDNPQSVVYGRVVAAWVDQSLNTDPQNPKHFVDAKTLDPISRLGGDSYAGISTPIKSPRS